VGNRRSSAGGQPAQPFGLELSLAVFDRATRIARALFPGGDALITLMQDGKAWRSRRFDGTRLGPHDRLAQQVVETGELLWIEDARLDPRLQDNELVVGPPHLRSLIAAPIRLGSGARPGALFVAHTEPQPFDRTRAARLQDLADFVAEEWARAKAAETERRLERERNAAQSRFSAVTEKMPISLVVTDLDQRVMASSRVWRDSLGLGDTPATGRPLLELSPVYQHCQDAFARAQAGETVGAIQLEIRRADRSSVWTQAQIMLWRNAQDEPAGFTVISNDITELKAALEAAERSEDRLNLALGITDVHVWEMDYVRRELTKAGAEDTFFEQPQTFESLSRDIYGVVDARDKPMVIEAWRAHVEAGVPYRPQYRIARADGKEVWVEAWALQFPDARGRVPRLVGALRNITEAKQAERKLIEAMEAAEAANTAKSQFLATISHEIRTPLNGVLGMAQAMAADALSEVQSVRLDVLRESGQALLAILNDVLDISKIEAGKLELEQAEFDLGEIVESALGAFAALAEKKGLALKLKVAPAARGRCRGDATRVRQILSNLISNALKFTESGEVAVSVARRSETVRIEVRDTGIGIAPAGMTRLFEKFEQGDASTTRRYGGSGLGLAICRQLAEMMGGRIAATSREGAGATFVVSLELPRVAAARAARAGAGNVAPEHGAGAWRILAAEDNAVNQLVLRTLLGQLGMAATIVDDGADALAAWEQGAWDVVLMDVQMPRMDGPTAARAIRRREAELGRPPTPILALTANAMAHQVAEYHAAGMDEVVAKPIDVAQLAAALERAVAGAEAARLEAAG
jgi:PAS domain S-box-containing protein